ncbi:hypothetical protein PINS_up020932 [Pythium insidiosum]|nr:hypothetical protein PINS_up020932 [Pythium insidiosum]
MTAHHYRALHAAASPRRRKLSGAALMARIRVLLLGCVVLYVALLWWSGIWSLLSSVDLSGTSSSSSSTPLGDATGRRQQPHSHYNAPSSPTATASTVASARWTPTRPPNALAALEAEKRAHLEELQNKRKELAAEVRSLRQELRRATKEYIQHARIVADYDAQFVAPLPTAYTHSRVGSSLREFKCLGWRATADCSPDGARRPEKDRDCVTHVRPGDAGYCEIQDVVSGERFRVMRTSCDSQRGDLRCLEAGAFANAPRLALDVLHNVSLSEPKHLRPQREADSNEGTRGIVMVVYPKLLPSAYATLHALRRVNCSLPVELWFKPQELVEVHPILQAMATQAALAPVTLRRIDDLGAQHFTTKIYALQHSAFDHVLFLDADNVPVRDPTFLFALREYRSTGALFWPDFWHPQHTIFNLHERSLAWEYLGLDFVDMFEQESGQLVIHRTRASNRAALALLAFYAFHEPPLLDRFRIVHGDKDLFRFAWLKANASFHMIARPPGAAGTVVISEDRERGQRNETFCGLTMVQHDVDGNVLFLHRNARKLMGRTVETAQATGVKVERVDDAIWTVLQQFERGGARGDYRIDVFRASKDAPQFCYGKQSLSAPHFTTTPFEELPFATLEDEIRRAALEASEILRSVTK